LREFIIREINHKELGPIIQAIESREGRIANISYNGKITVNAYLPESMQDWLNDMVKNISHGMVTVKIGQVKWYKKVSLFKSLYEYLVIKTHPIF